MKIALTRVDCRLIHGQIIESWLPAIQAALILVAGDAVARDPWRISIMRACVPDNVRVQFVGVEDLPAALAREAQGEESLILLLGSVQNAWQAFEIGVHFSHLNLGNVSEHPGSSQITETVHLAAEDQALLRTLQARGVEIEIRATSRERPLRASEFLG